MSACDQLPYAIAPGHNNAAGLTVIEGLAPFGGQAFKTFRGWSMYDPGQFIVMPTGMLYTSGFPSTQWVFSWMSDEQLYYFMTTYGNAGYSGLVTVATTTDIPNTLVTHNATMVIEKLPQQNPYFNQYLGGVIKFTRMVAIDSLFMLESGLPLQLETGDQLLLEN